MAFDGFNYIDSLPDHRTAYDIHKWVSGQKKASNMGEVIGKRNSYLVQLDSSYSTNKTSSLGSIETRRSTAGFDYFYDSLDVAHTWSIDGQNLNPGSFSTRLYNADNNLIHLQSERWDGLYGNWENRISPYGLHYNYNEDKQILNIEYAYIDSSGSDARYLATQYYYDSLSNLDKVDYSSRTTGWGYDTILLKSTVDYNYDLSGRLQSSVSHQLRLPQFEWVGRDSIVYGYDSQERLETMEVYNGPDSLRRPLLLETYVYLPNGKIDKRIINTSYSDSIFTRENIYKYSYYDYGSLNSIIESVSSLGNPHIDYFKTQYWHDSTIVADQVRFSRNFRSSDKRFDLYEQNHLITKMVVVNLRPDIIYKPELFIDLFYVASKPVSNENLPEVNDFRVYPVPASDRIYMNWDESKPLTSIVRISNTKGQLVLSNSILNLDSGIDISELSSGLYFITVIGEHNKVFQSRFIKQ